MWELANHGGILCKQLAASVYRCRPIGFGCSGRGHCSKAGPPTVTSPWVAITPSVAGAPAVRATPASCATINARTAPDPLRPLSVKPLRVLLHLRWTRIALMRRLCLKRCQEADVERIPCKSCSQRRQQPLTLACIRSTKALGPPVAPTKSSESSSGPQTKAATQRVSQKHGKDATKVSAETQGEGIFQLSLTNAISR